MCIRDAICERYEPQLAAIAALDREYYSNKAPTAADRAAYYSRQEALESIRAQMYRELEAVKKAPHPTTWHARASFWPA